MSEGQPELPNQFSDFQISDVIALISTLSLLLDCWYPGFRYPKPWPYHLAPVDRDLKLGIGDEFDHLNPEAFITITEEDFNKANQ